MGESIAEKPPRNFNDPCLALVELVVTHCARAGGLSPKTKERLARVYVAQRLGWIGPSAGVAELNRALRGRGRGYRAALLKLLVTVSRPPGRPASDLISQQAYSVSLAWVEHLRTLDLPRHPLKAASRFKTHLNEQLHPRAREELDHYPEAEKRVMRAVRAIAPDIFEPRRETQPLARDVVKRPRKTHPLTLEVLAILAHSGIEGLDKVDGVRKRLKRLKASGEEEVPYGDYDVIEDPEARGSPKVSITVALVDEVKGLLDVLSRVLRRKL